MSQDLFAAFGETASPAPTIQDSREAEIQPQSQISRQQDSDKNGSVQNDWTQSVATSRVINQDFEEAGDDDDDFGDFEDASAASITKSPPRDRDHALSKAQNKTVSVASTQASRSNDSAVPASNIPPQKVKPLPFKPRTEVPNAGQHPFAGRMDLLFDADDDEYDAGDDELGDLSKNPEAAMAYSKRIIAEQQAAVAKKDMSHNGFSKPAANISGQHSDVQFNKDQRREQAITRPTGGAPTQSQQVMDVLFDADDPDDQADDDDWGDFEGTSEEAKVSTSNPNTDAVEPKITSDMTAFDLLSIDDGPTEIIRSSHSKTDYHSHSSLQAPVQNSMTTVSQDQDPANDTWDDFEPTAPSAQQHQSQRSPEYPQTPSSSIPKVSIAQKTELPPINIPPPSMILSIFPSLFTRANDDLLNTLSKLSQSQKQEFLAHPASIQYLEAHLKKCVVLAYIVAGRKLRWKRDQRLVQSMRIGPAAAGGKGGLKLVGVDKSEIAKEDRETVDTVRLYRASMGRLQSAVTGAMTATSDASGKSAKLTPVPNVEERMIVKALKSAEGGFSAPRPCALCALKREERVVKVDREVEDSFGEWWVDGLEMHVVCRDFWAQEGDKLRGR